MAHKCPSCGEPFNALTAPRTSKQRLIGGWTCQQCGYEIDWLGREVAKSTAQNINLRAPQKPTNQPQRLTKDAFGPWSIINIFETHRSEEYVGQEQRVIDNTRSNSPSNRKLSISREWSKTYVIEQEKAQRVGGELHAGIQILAALSASIENAITTKYSIADQNRQFHAEEIEVTIPSRTRLRLFLQWKRIWQHGVVRLRNKKNIEMEVPFQVIIELTFDQAQVDET
jgi:hypothetical protein